VGLVYLKGDYVHNKGGWWLEGDLWNLMSLCC